MAAESGKARWCLYLPGLCIHAVPLAPGSDEELHVRHPQTPPDFSFYHLEPASSNKSPAGQQASIQRSKLRLSLYSDESSLEQHPALQDSSKPGPPPESHPTLRPEQPLEDQSAPRPNSRPSISSKKHLTFAPKMPSPLSKVTTPVHEATLQELAKLIDEDKAFENTSTNVAASQMRNALNSLADTVTDTEQKKV
jgi:UTP--glucose-1-phosphate uridylyltransferase